MHGANNWALPGLNPTSTRRGNRITAGGGPSNSDDFYGEGAIKPDRRVHLLSSKMRDSNDVNLNSFNSTMNMNDSVLNKRLDNFEQRLVSQDTHQRDLLEQLMKFQQENRMEMKRLENLHSEEKSHRQRAETVIKNQMNQISDLEDKVRLNESISRSNKSSLDQLLTHTKNIERGVSLSHQDILLKKDTQEQRINDILNKISNTDSTRDSLEKMTYAAREEAIASHNRVESLSSDVKDLKDSFQLLNKMFDTRDSTKGHSGPKISDTQKSIMESKILQLQGALMEIQSQVNKEIKEREIDDHSIVSRLDELKIKIDDSLRKRDEEIKNIRKSLKNSPSMSESEKQSILIKISSLETELQRMSEQQGDSSTSSPELMKKLSQLEKDLSEEKSTRRNNESSLLKKTEGEYSQNKLLIEENVDGLRKIFQAENGTIQERLQSLMSDRRQLEKQVGENSMNNDHILEELDSRQKLLETRVEGINDRLLIGMNSLQVEIGDTKLKKEGTETSQLPVLDIQGVQESFMLEVTTLDNKIKELKRELRQNENKIQNHFSDKKDNEMNATTILGDKIQQKIDSLAFVQGRMKRQVDDIHKKVESQELSEEEVTLKLKSMIDSIQHSIDGKLVDLTAKMDERFLTRDDELREIRKSSQKNVGFSETDKTDIHIKMSSMETELKRLSDERDNKSASELRNRIKKIEKQMNEDYHSQQNRDYKLAQKTEAEFENIRVQLEDSLKEIRTLILEYNLTVQKRFQAFTDDQKSVEKKMEGLKSPDFLENMNRRFKILDARINDLTHSPPSKKSNSSQKGKLSDSNGLHESLLSEINSLNDEIKDIRTDIQRRDEEILFLINQNPDEKNLSKVLGDKLQYKMDSLAIVQGRMRRQMKDMEKKFENNEAPSERLTTPGNSKNDIQNNEAEFGTIKHELEESLKEIRAILLEYNLSIQKRFQTFNDDHRRLERRLDELSSSTNLDTNTRGLSGKYKVLDAKIDDVNERLLFGMNSLQVSLGDQLQELNKVQLDSNKFPDAQGLRESLRLEINELNDAVNNIKRDLNSRKDVVRPQSLRTPDVLGDKWQQKIDNIAFVQERMKRQIDDVEKKVESHENSGKEIFSKLRHLSDEQTNESKISSEITDKVSKLEVDLLQEQKIRRGSVSHLIKKIETDRGKNKVLVEESVDGVWKLLHAENQSLQERTQSLMKNTQGLDEQVTDLRNEMIKSNRRVKDENDVRTKVLDAKMEDMNDRFLLGMNTLQVAVGDPSRVPYKTNALSEAQSVKESLIYDIASLEDQVKDLKRELDQRDERILSSLKENHHKEEHANTILGDDVQRKIDYISFKQDIMNRQVNEIQGKVENDLKEKVVEVSERQGAHLDDYRKFRTYTEANLRRHKNNNSGTSPYELQKLNEKVYEIENDVKRLEKERPSTEGVSRKELQDVKDELEDIKKTKVRSPTPPLRQRSPSPPQYQRNPDPNYSHLKQQVEDIEEQNKYQSEDFKKFKVDTEDQLSNVKRTNKEVDKKLDDLEYRTKNQEKDFDVFKNQTQDELKVTKNAQNKVLSQVEDMDKVQRLQTGQIKDVKSDLGEEIKERKNEENEMNQAHQRLRGRVKRLKLRVRKIKEVVLNTDQADSEDDDKGDI